MRKLIFILIALISFSQAQTIQYIGAPTTTVISRGNFRTDSIFYLPKRTKLPTDTAAFRYQISDSSLYYWTGYQWMKVGNNQDTASMLSNYLRGSGTINYIPKFNSTRSVVDSKLYESNLNLLFNSTTPYLTTSGISTIENNGTSAALYVLKTLDTARAYVSFGGANTMDINNLRAGDIRFYTNATLRGRFQTDGTFRLNSLTGTGSRIVVADDNGVLSATSSATGLVDTTVISTRAYRQKGDDSLGAIIATKGSGTVTSVSTGYGLSGGTITTTGTLIADTLNLSTRAWRQKGLDSLAALEISGSGTTNYVAKFTNTRELGNSQIFDNGTNVGIGTTSPSANGLTILKPSTQGSEISLRGNNNSAASEFLLAQANDGNTTYIYNRANGRMYFGTNNTARLLIRSDGEVLINTETDAGAYTLQNNGALYNNGDIYFNVGVGFTSLITQTLGGGGLGMVSRIDPTASGNRLFSLGFGSINYPAQARFEAYASEAWSSTARGTYITLRTTPNGSTGIQDRMFIGNDGFVGVNTNSPLARMHVAGNFRTDNDAYFATSSGSIGIGRTNPSNKVDLLVNTNGFDGYNVYGQQGGGGEIIGFRSQQANGIGLVMGTTGAFATSTISGANQSVIYSVGNQNLIIGTNTTEALRINASQETLFGTTTDAGNYRVQVSGNAYVTGDAILAATSGGVQAGTLTTSSNYVIRAGRSNSSVGDNIINTVAHFSNTYNNNTNGNIAYPVLSLERVGASGISNNSLFEIGLARYDTINTNAFTQVNFIVRDGNSTSRSTLATFSNSTITFRTSDTERIRIHSNGGLKYVPQSAAPTAEAGTVYYDSDDNKLKVYNGTTWVDLH